MAKLILGEVLRKKSLSKRKFAKLIGEEYANVFRYFRPTYDPKLSKLAFWAKKLGVRVRDLIRE
jgi:hypothetical protein